MTKEHALALAGLLALALTGFAAWRADSTDRQHCVTTGGEIVIVRTWRTGPFREAGWFCSRP